MSGDALPSPPSQPRWTRNAAWAALAGLAYIATGKLSLELASVHASASPVWPPTGIGIATLMLLGRQWWPVMWAGAFVVNVTTAGTVWTSFAIATGNAAEAWAGAFLAQRFCGGRAAFGAPKTLARYTVLTGFLATSISPTVGATAFALAGFAAWSSYGAIWGQWWLGDAMGALLVAPLILLWADRTERRIRSNWEVAAAYTTIVAAALLVFFQPEPLPGAFLLVPLIYWPAARLGARGAATASALMATVVIAATLVGRGPFALLDPPDAMVFAQRFVGVITFTGLLVAAAVFQRDRSAEALRRSRDTLESRVAERTVQVVESRRLFHSFMTDIPGPAWVKDQRGRYTFANAAFAKLLRRGPSEVVGRTDVELLPTDVAAANAKHEERVRNQGVVQSTQQTFESEGQKRHFLVRRFPIPGAEGHPSFLGAIGLDVTTEAETRASLERSQARLAEAQAVARLGSWDWAIGQNRITWSDELYRIFGYAPGEIDVDYERFLAGLHEDDRGRVDAIVKAAYATHEPFEFEHRVVRPDGSIRWLAGKGRVVVGPDGKASRMMGTGQDITDRKTSEESFRQLLESTPDALLVADGRGRITRVNEAAERLFGYDRHEIVGQSVETLVPLELRGRHVAHRAAFASHPSSRPMGVGLELKAIRKDGSEFPVEIALSPIQTPAGSLAIATVRDISERNRIDRERRELEQLRRMNEFKEQFINMAAHELNTPLTPLKLQVHLLRRAGIENLTDRQRKSIDILERNLERVSVLVQNMLDVGRIQSGRVQVRLAAVDLREVASDVMESLDEFARAHGVSMESRIERPVLVAADAQRMHQILMNLLSNAIKFTPAGGRVTVSAASEARHALLRIRDTGVGLGKDQLAKLFQPFSQVHAEVQTARSTGTGLGLYISRELARLQGGQLWAESPGPNQGSTFSFSIPILVPEGGLPAAGPAVDSPVAASARNAGPEDAEPGRAT